MVCSNSSALGEIRYRVLQSGSLLANFREMGAAWKPPPLLCWKLPWLPQPIHKTPAENHNPCGTLDTPWLFKPLQNLGTLAQIFLDSAVSMSRGISPEPSAGSRRPDTRKSAAAALSREEQGEVEHRVLAAALASRKEATVIEFYSPKCRLCHSLLDLVLELEARNSDWVSFVLADAENEKWLPELIYYDVKYVPCFVLLDKHGKALAKTGVPTSRLHVIAGLSHLLQLKQPRSHKNLPQ